MAAGLTELKWKEFVASLRAFASTLKPAQDFHVPQGSCLENDRDHIR